MLETLARNYNNRNLSARLYEIAKEYIPNEDSAKLPAENEKIMLGLYGEDYDFYTVKGAVEALLEKFGIKDYDVEASSEQYSYHPGRCAVIKVDGKQLAVLGEIHPKVAENYGMQTRVYTAEICAETLFELRNMEKNYKSLPKFPAVTRDLAIVCDRDVPVLELEKAIRKGAGKLLESLTLFDVYQGDRIDKDKKSVAYSITLRSAEASLTADEAQNIVNKVIANLEKIGAALRS